MSAESDNKLDSLALYNELLVATPYTPTAAELTFCDSERGRA